MDTESDISPNRMTMRRFNVYLDSELREELIRYSAESGIPLSEMVRRGTAAWLEKQRQRERSFA